MSDDSMRKFLNMLKRNDLHLWVFTTGAMILIIEIVAVRILAPYFGNTLFSVSSVLSVVLLALSAGYWFGGNLSDKTPKRELFYSIIAASGVLLLFMELVRNTVLEIISRNFSLEMGPLVSAIILFIGPAFLLGMLSPFAIKLKSEEQKKLGIGRVTGGMFFWSTLGSITGSVMAGFVLVPQFGVDSIMLTIGILLVLMGAVPLSLNKKISTQKIVAIVVLAAALAAGVVASREADAANVLYKADGVYENITIAEGTYQGKPTRFLVQDRSQSGAAFIDSDELVYEYTKYYVVYEAFETSLEEALVLGGGAWSIPRAIHNEPEAPVVDVVDIEPDLYDLSVQYFDAPVSDRMNNFVEDGRRFVAQSDKKYDLIYGDVFKSLFSLPTHMTTKEFLEEVKDHLTDDGVYISNVIGDTYRVDDSMTLAEMKTWREVFPNSRFYAVRNPASPETQNLIFVGGHGDSPKEIDYDALRSHENPVLADLGEHELDPTRFPLDKQITLTDNYAPVDFMVSKMLSRSRGSIPTLGEQTLAIVEQLLSYGPRHSGSAGSQRAIDFIQAEIAQYTDVRGIQAFEEGGINYTNILGSLGPGKERRLILGTHFDSKKYANLDEENTQAYVPGANDSSSGVAALLMVMRELHAQGEWPYDFGIDFVFFDGEEGPPSVDQDPSIWKPVGSTMFANTVEELYRDTLPEAGLILDMVCEKDALFTIERNSSENAQEIVDKYWTSGEKVQSRHFSRDIGPGIRDDHSPLNAIGIPTALVIDFDYKHFHTAQDTLDKCSASTLQSVVATTLDFIRNYDEQE